MKKRRLRIKWKNLLLLIILIVFMVSIVISLLNILNWYHDSKKTKKQSDDITKNIKIETIEDDGNTELIEPDDVKEEDPYWNYIKMNLLEVNYNELLNINHDTKGFIKVNGTNVNYPFVQANDNEYYLTHSYDKSYNKAGWVFLDYRNNITTLDRNNILYAHARNDNTMFGSLRSILKNNWQKKTNNHVVWISTENMNTLWQVFSVYKIPTTSDYLKTSFSDNNEFLKFTNMLKERSIYDFNGSISANDKIITLSTCANKSERIVLHAKLIKLQKK